MPTLIIDYFIALLFTPAYCLNLPFTASLHPLPALYLHSPTLHAPCILLNYQGLFPPSMDSHYLTNLSLLITAVIAVEVNHWSTTLLVVAGLKFYYYPILRVPTCPVGYPITSIAVCVCYTDCCVPPVMALLCVVICLSHYLL